MRQRRVVPTALALAMAMASAGAAGLSPSSSAMPQSGSTPARAARLFESERIRYGTGKIVPAGALGEKVVLREEPGGGATAFVSAPANDDQRGAIYVFERDAARAWRWAQTLLTDDVFQSASYHEDVRELGASLALDGDRLLAGAPFHHWQHGAAYVFERDGSGRWLPAGQLIPMSEEAMTRGFGTSVALDGDRALVGAFHDDDGQGAAYLFARQSDGRWSQVQRIASHHYASPNAAGWPSVTRFGASVALEGDTAVIGATMARRERGAATVYTMGPNGRLVRGAELRPDRATEGFGVTLALEGDTVVVGAKRDAYYYGAAYAFVREAGGVWRQSQMLAPRGRQAGDSFGIDLSLDGDRIAIGASGLGGYAYVFERREGHWWEVLRLAVPVAGPRPFFGRSVALAGETLVVGDIGDTEGCPTADGCHTGAAHAYRLARAAASTRLEEHYEQKLVHTGGTIGSQVAAYDDLVLVADEGADDACRADSSCDSGAVHVLEPGRGGGWVETQRLLPLVLSAGARFGASIAHDGDWLAVGAVGRWDDCRGEDCGTSAVHLYRRDGSGGWVEAQRILSPLDEPGFGASVALRGDSLFVGRSQHGARSEAGAVHIFQLSEATGRWQAMRSHTLRSLGSRLAVTGLAADEEQLLAHSAIQMPGGTTDVGIAVIGRSGGDWEGLQQFIVAEGIAAPYLAASDGLLALRTQEGGRSEVQVYRRGGEGLWAFEAVLRAPEGGGQHFGSGLSVSDGRVFVGEGPMDGSGPGLAHLFHQREGDPWRIAQTMRPSEPGEAGGFGAAVSIGGRAAVVVAPGVTSRPDSIPGHITLYWLLDPQLYLPSLNLR